MNLSDRLEEAVKAYAFDNMSLEDLLSDLGGEGGVSRGTLFTLKKHPSHEKKMFPSTKRKLIKQLELLGF